MTAVILLPLIENQENKDEFLRIVHDILIHGVMLIQNKVNSLFFRDLEVEDGMSFYNSLLYKNQVVLRVVLNV